MRARRRTVGRVLHVRREAGGSGRVVLAAAGKRALVDMPDIGKVVMGRGAVNQKGPEAAFLAALHAIRGAGRKLPVNLVLVAEGEEEIGSPHFAQIVRAPEVEAALAKCTGIFMPAAAQDARRQRDRRARREGRGGARARRERREVGPRPGEGRPLEQSRRTVDSPAWHLVQALNTLVDRRTAIRRSTAISTAARRSARPRRR